MAKRVSIPIEKRDFSVNAKKLRASGKIPATIYGHGFDSLSVQIDARSFMNIFKRDKTAIFDLKSGKNTYNALAKEVQYSNSGDEVYNIEFHKIITDEKVKIMVPVEIVGESPAVRAGGVLWNPITEIEIECLPNDIPASIKVDISDLKNIEDTIRVEEIKYPAGVHAASGQESIVVKINPSKIAAVITSAEEVSESI